MLLLNSGTTDAAYESIPNMRETSNLSPDMQLVYMVLHRDGLNTYFLETDRDVDKFGRDEPETETLV